MAALSPEIPDETHERGYQEQITGGRRTKWSQITAATQRLQGGQYTLAKMTNQSETRSGHSSYANLACPSPAVVVPLSTMRFVCERMIYSYLLSCLHYVASACPPALYIPPSTCLLPTLCAALNGFVLFPRAAPVTLNSGTSSKCHDTHSRGSRYVPKR